MKYFFIATALVLTAALPTHKAAACSHVLPNSNFYLTINGVSQEQRKDFHPVLTDAKGNDIGLADFMDGGYEAMSTSPGTFTLTLDYKSEVVLTHVVEVKKGLCYTAPVTVTVSCDTTPNGLLSCATR